MKPLVRVLIVFSPSSRAARRLYRAPAPGVDATRSPDAAAAARNRLPLRPARRQASGSPSDDVLPALTPKADLKPVPQGEVNVAYAPNVPPAATRDHQAIVDVHFDVVEGVKAIDPERHRSTRPGATACTATTRSPPARPARSSARASATSCASR